MPRTLPMAALLLSAAACGSPDDAAQGTAGPSAKMPPAFARCAGCHSVEPGRNAAGPSLHGVVGRRAGTAPGFLYSPALEQSGVVWGRDTLDRWLAAPMAMVPGTRMAVGEPDPAQRREIVDYLEHLQASQSAAH